MTIYQEIISWILLILVIALLLWNRGILKRCRKEKLVNANYKIESEEELEWR